MNSQRHVAWAGLALVACLGACGGDDGGSGGAADARPATADARPAGGAPDAFVVIPVGTDVIADIHLYDDPLGDAVFAEFRKGAKIVRLPEAPECVIHLEPERNDVVPAGTLTVGGSIVGSTGGPTAVLTPRLDGNQYVYFGAVYAAGAAVAAEVSLTATASFPAMPLRSLNVPPATPVTLIKPADPGPGPPPSPEFKVLRIPGSAAFEIAWTKPSDWDASYQVFVILRDVSCIGCAAKATVHCAYPISAGAVTIPASLLTFVQQQTGQPAVGNLAIGAGRHVEHAGDGFSYFIELVSPNGSTMHSLYNIGLYIE